MTNHPHHKVAAFRRNAQDRMLDIGLRPDQVEEVQRQIDLAYKQFIDPTWPASPMPKPANEVSEAGRTLAKARKGTTNAGS